MKKLIILFSFLCCAGSQSLYASCLFADIISPTSYSQYSAGQSIYYEGAGNGGSCTLTDYQWTVKYYDFLVSGTVPVKTQTLPNQKSGYFTVPVLGSGENYDVIHIHLVSNSASYDDDVSLNARKTDITLSASPAAGASLFLSIDTYGGGIPPTTRQIWTGKITTISAPSSMVYNSQTYVFDHWSDGGARSHDITVPATSTNYTVYYKVSADQTPPVISNISVSGITSNSAIVNWTTNEPATSQVLYGLTSSYTNYTTLDNSFVTTHSASISGLSAFTSYHYSILAQDAAGNMAYSADAVFNTAASVTPPTILTQPLNQTVNEGQTATFSITASGSPAPTYQWQKNGVNIPGATSASYTTPATTGADNNTVYSCVVTNTVGTVTSRNANLNVQVQLTVVSGNGSGFYNVGTNVTITANAAPSGQVFDNWTGATVTVDPINPLKATLVMPAANTTVTANYRSSAAGSLSFSLSNYVRSEDKGAATITVKRNGGVYGAASVEYKAYAGTARESKDFDPTSGVLNWADGDSAAKTFLVNILDDTIPEPDEIVNLLLTNATGASLDTYYSSAIIIIRDNDLVQLSVENGSGSGFYNIQSVVSITAQPVSAGQMFTKWTGPNGEDVSNFVTPVTSAHASVIMPAVATTVRANFKTTTVAVISSPQTDQLFVPGQVINYSGDGTNSVYGVVPQQYFTWVMETTDSSNHVVSQIIRVGDKQGSFTIPTPIYETDPVIVKYKLTLIVDGIDGDPGSTSVSNNAKTAQITLDTVPSGFTIVFNGVPHVAPWSWTDFIGGIRSLDVIAPQSVDGKQFKFVSWSDNGASHHDISFPANNTTFTAKFQEAVNNPPVVQITTLDSSLVYSANKLIMLHGSASDPEDGAITAVGNYSWNVAYYGGSNLLRTVTMEGSGAYPTFMIGNDKEESTESMNYFYRITLRVRDSGLVDSQFFGFQTGETHIDIHPMLSNVTLQTNPVGGKIFVDGISITPLGPANLHHYLANSSHEFKAADTFVIDGQLYKFVHWLDGVTANPRTSNVTTSLELVAVYIQASVTITGVSPNSGPTAGNQLISITGTNFVEGAKVKLDGIPATDISFVSANKMMAAIPAHAAGVVDVTVTNPDGGSATLPGSFTYIHTQYYLLVDNGAGSDFYYDGDTVNISANPPTAGHIFDKWISTNANFVDANSPQTTFVMPAATVRVTATYKDLPLPTYLLTVVDGLANGLPTGNYHEGETINLMANPTSPEMVFDKWTGATVMDLLSPSTTLVMPAAPVTITANYKNVGGQQLFGEAPNEAFGQFINATSGPMTISFGSSQDQGAELTVYSTEGHQVRKLFNGTAVASTNYVTWDGRNDDGEKVVPDVYLAVLKIGGKTQFQKIAIR